MTIKPIPMTYSGQRFRSTLEADWAATLDRYNIKWIYEPEAYRLDNINYLPDFYMPEIRVWAEAKGPLNERLDKAQEFQRALDAYHVLDFDDEWELERQHVVILRPDVRGQCDWEAATDDRHMVVVVCPRCERLAFMDRNPPWRCRYGCENYVEMFWEADGGDIFFGVGDQTLFSRHHLPFFKAPRPFGRGAR